MPRSLILDWQNSWTQERATSPLESWAHLGTTSLSEDVLFLLCPPLHLLMCFHNEILRFLSHLNSRYVAPEYANTGLLNEKSDIYSFGVLVLEAVTGRDPVDYSRPANEVPRVSDVLHVKFPY